MINNNDEHSLESENATIISECREALKDMGIDTSERTFTIRKFSFSSDGKKLPKKVLKKLRRQYSEDQLRVCIYAPRKSMLGGTGFFVIDPETKDIVAKYHGR